MIHCMQYFRDLIHDFRMKQQERIAEKRDLGWTGHDEQKCRESMITALIINVLKGQWVDVANFAMFLWNLDGRKKK